MDIYQTTMGKALMELNDKMEDMDFPKIKLSVIGGFAMMMNGLRPLDGKTDIDYVGTETSLQFKELSAEIGRKYDLGADWINSDVMLTGITQEDFELSTGKLHFKPAMDMSRLSIEVLVPEDLLRMKLISIDTSLMAIELGGDFTRIKDLPDIETLMRYLSLTQMDLEEKYGEYLESRWTKDIVRVYLEKGRDAVLPEIDKKRRKNILVTSAARMNRAVDTSGFSMMQSMLKKAMDRAKEEEYPL